MQSAWKVDIVTFFASAFSTMPARRSRISFAALFVKVTASTCAGSTPCASRYATRMVITRVFPVPAPARISSGPSVVRTAISCSGLRSKRRMCDMGKNGGTGCAAPPGVQVRARKK